ncbi:hypothetical protein BDR03DRAFT_876669, partial [Suillus americanus]
MVHVQDLNDSGYFYGDEGGVVGLESDLPGSVEEPLGSQALEKPYIERFRNTAKVYRRGQTFWDRFNMDPYSAYRKDNLYYPFASHQDWELGSFLLCSSLSMAAIDEFLELKLELLERTSRIYNEWLTGDAAWSMQSQLPDGATLLGIILSSDKTNITNMTGGRVAHPLLISLANIKMATRNKASSHAFLLTALLPIAEFLHPVKRMQSVLEARLVHQCLDIVLEPLKQAARIGRMMSDPLGNLRYCFTPLASYIVDTPEACMLACVQGKTSPITMAMYENFGDAFQHSPQTAKMTLNQLSSISCDPLDIEGYFNACAPFRLSGVAQPFWRDWSLADPHVFFTPEPLHHWHREFYDHDVKWCLAAVG